MHRWLEWSTDAVIAASCAGAWYVFPDPTVRAASATAGLCLFALRHPGIRKTAATTASPLVNSAHEQSAVKPPARARGRVALTSSDTPGDFVAQMISQGRSALLLRSQIADSLSADELAIARTAVDEDLAMVPGGDVLVMPRGADDTEAAQNSAGQLVPVAPFLLDRYPVTNHDYQAFVDDGGYQQSSLWEPAIWPAVLQFVDQTGQAGPKPWNNGCYPESLANHPVVGISWFEANAYARWAGKRLPTDPEWTKAAAWPVSEEGTRPRQLRFPWGDATNSRLANLWGGSGTTTAVDHYPDGGAINGVYDLIGNAWEWTASPFDEFAPPRLRWDTATPLRAIRGGAFDTYFDSQAATTFASGADPFLRAHNIGFRCAVSLQDLKPEEVVMNDAACELNVGEVPA